MTASGLRREISRGRLVVERIAGKDYTTLAAIERMRDLYRVNVKVPDFGSGGGDEDEYPIPCRTLTMNVVLKLIDNEFLF